MNVKRSIWILGWRVRVLKVCITEWLLPQERLNRLIDWIGEGSVVHEEWYDEGRGRVRVFARGPWRAEVNVCESGDCETYVSVFGKNLPSTFLD